MKHILLSLLLFVCTISFGQYNPIIRTGRPGQTIGSFTVGKGVLQFHQGLDYTWGTVGQEFTSPMGLSSAGTVRLEEYFSQNVIRFGVAEKLEVSAGINYSWSNQFYDFGQNADPTLKEANIRTFDFKNVDLGFRYNILDGNNRYKLGWGIQARTGLYQWVFDEFVDAPDLKVITAIGRNLGEKSRFRINAGTTLALSMYDWIVYGLNYNYNPVPKLGFTLEYSGRLLLSSIVREKFEHKYLGAVHYLLCDDIMLDLRYGISDNLNSTFPSSSYLGAGISWRVRTTKR